MTIQNNDQKDNLSAVSKSLLKDTGTLMLWLITIVIIVLSITLYLSYLISFWDEVLAYKMHHPIIQLMKLVNENWKAFLIILIPLFYREIADLISRIKKIGPIEAYPQKERTTTVLEDMK